MRKINKSNLIEHTVEGFTTVLEILFKAFDFVTRRHSPDKW